VYLGGEFGFKGCTQFAGSKHGRRRGYRQKTDQAGSSYKQIRYWQKIRHAGRYHSTMSATSKRAALLVNCRSRQGEELFDDVVKACEGAGILLGEAVLVKSQDECACLLKREVDAGAPFIIAGGGDGTLSFCAGQLAGTNTALAALPLGTGNTFARSLALPFNLGEAARVIAAGHIVPVDVGMVNGRVFLNSVTLGFSVEIAQALDARIKDRLGLLAWPVCGWSVFWKHRALRLRITAAGRDYRLYTHQLVVANGRYVAGPIAATPDASIESHRLEVFALGRADRAGLIRAGLKWLLGQRVRTPETRFDGSKPLLVSSMRGILPASVDGEMSEQTPLELKVWPGGLKVVVPHEFEENSGIV
jgi:diacylglycerol kinase (ATP)